MEEEAVMSFDLKVNERIVTRVSVIRKSRGWYEWNAWRVGVGGPRYHAAGELEHRAEDGIEVLAMRVLADYRQVHPTLPPTRR